MRIGVDGGCWSNARGYGRYTREIVGGLVEWIAEHRLGEVRLFVDRQSAETCGFPDSARLVEVPTREAASRAARDGGRRSLRDLAAFRAAVRPDELDVFFFPSVYTYFPLRGGVPAVVAVHDAIPEAVPELVFPHRRDRLLWSLKVRAALRRADRVVTVSRFAREQVLRHHRLDPARVEVVPEAPAAVFAPPQGGPDPGVLGRYGLTPDLPFFLFVGGLAPHKNLDAALDALELLEDEPGGEDACLVLVGDASRDVFHTNAGHLRARAGALRAGQVRILGYVPDADLVHLYSAARATVLPSFQEGFGLPVFEAAACGGATIATRASAAPELLAGGSLLVDPERPGELADAMRRVLADEALRRRLGRLGLERTRGLGWRRSALELLRILARSAGSPLPPDLRESAAPAREPEWPDPDRIAAGGGPRVSVIVPGHDAAATVEACLSALGSQDVPRASYEVVFVDDASRDATPQLAGRWADRVLRLRGRAAGPAAARNAGAAAARGDVLLFLDADVVPAPGTIRGLLQPLEDPGLDAVFGAYDAEPAHASLVSQYRNLLHHHVHLTSRGEAETFWAGCGAVRRAAFESVGGFDAARYPVPSIEDIELGRRMRARGMRIRLDPDVQVKHLKRWTLPGVLRSDLFDRGIPWMRLLLEGGGGSRSVGHLNLRWAGLASVPLAWGAVTFLAAGLRSPALGALGAASVVGLVAVNLPTYAFFRRARGWSFTLAALPLHVLHHLGNGVAAAVALAELARRPQRWARLRASSTFCTTERQAPRVESSSL